MLLGSSMAFVLDFQSCDEVDDDLIESAFAAPDEANQSLPKDRVFRLLDRMARVSRPNSGIGRILWVLSCVSRASWLGGRLDVLARESATGCEVDVRLDEGTRFDSLKLLVLYAPLAELILFADENREILLPLQVFSDLGGGELRLRIPIVRPASGADPDEIHARDTTKVRVQRVPKEAYNAEALRASSRPTTRLPAVRPAPGAEVGKPDKTDDGWEEK
jgi:hypothetical protein